LTRVPAKFPWTMFVYERKRPKRALLVLAF
jgi:hypothetical protein